VTKTIPSTGRVQVVTQDLLEQDALTIRVDSTGADIEVYSSEGQEGDGFPLRSDDEIVIREEDGFGSAEASDGLWMETATANPSSVFVLKGVAVERNARRDVAVTTTVRSNSFRNGEDFDTTTYPLTIDPVPTVQQILLSIVEGEIELDVTTTDGDVVTIPVDSKSVIDSYFVEEFTLRDPSGTTPRVAGGWAGE